VGTVPIYLSEISSPEHRGLIGGISGCGIAFGTMVYIPLSLILLLLIPRLTQKPKKNRHRIGLVSHAATPLTDPLNGVYH
jgi:hypothetical protein